MAKIEGLRGGKGIISDILSGAQNNENSGGSTGGAGIFSNAISSGELKKEPDYDSLTIEAGSFGELFTEIVPGDAPPLTSPFGKPLSDYNYGKFMEGLGEMGIDPGKDMLEHLNETVDEHAQHADLEAGSIKHGGETVLGHIMEHEVPFASQGMQEEGMDGIQALIHQLGDNAPSDPGLETDGPASHISSIAAAFGGISSQPSFGGGISGSIIGHGIDPDTGVPCMSGGLTGPQISDLAASVSLQSAVDDSVDAKPEVDPWAAHHAAGCRSAQPSKAAKSAKSADGPEMA